MRVQIFVFVVVIIVTSIALMGCDPPPVQCTRLCDRVYYAEELRADVECGGLDTPQSNAEEACRDSCHDEWDESSEDVWDVDRCLDCISDNIGTRPCWDRVEWVILNDCDDRCDYENFDFGWEEFYANWIAELDYNEECSVPAPY